MDVADGCWPLVAGGWTSWQLVVLLAGCECTPALSTSRFRWNLRSAHENGYKYVFLLLIQLNHATKPWFRLILAHLQPNRTEIFDF